MSKIKSAGSAMLDTGFLIRLLKSDDSLHTSAKQYFQYFLEKDYTLYVSTIAIAEYCVKGNLSELPFANVRVIPFNLDHARLAGEFAACLYEERLKGEFNPEQRIIIPNDTKMFAQADLTQIEFFVTTDTNSLKPINKLAESKGFTVRHLDIHKPIQQSLGVLF